MSRVGKKPIPIPKRVELTCDESRVTVKGEKGSLSMSVHPFVDIHLENETAHVKLKPGKDKETAMQGLTRALLANMVTGVSVGFQRNLEIVGIGYRASLSENVLALSIGYSHPINFVLPDGISATVDKNNLIVLTGIDKEKLGHTAATLKRLRPPEPYKGKGIRYSGEKILKKAGKTGTK
ncbi:MAG: 50S ribosomal protein L6 [Desulfatirhabdiaceae bacterium]